MNAPDEDTDPGTTVPTEPPIIKPTPSTASTRKLTSSHVSFSHAPFAEKRTSKPRSLSDPNALPRKSPPTGYRVTSFLSRLWMTWAVPVVWHGYFVRLEKESVPNLEKKGYGHEILPKAVKAWEEECKKGISGRSLFRVVWKMHGGFISFGAAMGITQGLLFAVARPLLLRQVIIICGNFNVPIVDSVGVVIAFCLVVLFEGILNAMSRQWLSVEFATMFYAWITGLIERKATRISSAAGDGAGDAPVLVGHNVNRLMEDLKWGCTFPFNLTSIIGGLFVLGFVLKLACLPGLAVMLLIFWGNISLGGAIRKIEKSGDAISARRIGLTQDLAANALGLKLAAWEEPFKNLLAQVRNQDTANIESARKVSVTSINLGRASPVLASSASILLLAFLYPTNLNAATIFTALMAFIGLRLPLIALPGNIIQGQNARVSMERIRGYLNMPDAERPEEDESLALSAEEVVFSWTEAVKEDGHNRDNRSETGSRMSAFRKKTQRWAGSMRQLRSMRAMLTAPGATESLADEDDDDDEDAGVLSKDELRGGAFGEDIDITNSPVHAAGSGKGESLVMPAKAKRVVSHSSGLNVLVDYDKKRLVAVIGMVASGKSTLVSGLLGQLPLVRGKLKLTKRVGYVPQKAFNLSGTILDNILMGDPLNEEMLESALDASDFGSDVVTFKDGLYTVVGERGATLSGGQRQRLCICRAFYRDPKLLVLDDPLAAVDVRVANNIFHNGVIPFVRRPDQQRAVLMCLNQLHFLPHFDWIVVMHEGSIVEQGTYENLKDLENGRMYALLRDTPQPVQEASADKALLVSRAPSAPGSMRALLEKSNTGFASYYVPKPKTGKEDLLVSEETGKRGQGFTGVLGEYFRRMGRFQIPASLGLGAVAYGVSAANDILLAYWIRSASKFSFQDNINRAVLYFGLSIAHVVLVELLSILNMKGSVRASKRLHNDILERLLHAPISFYESTPSGRIVSRMSGDLGMVDRMLAFVFDDTIHFTFVLIALTTVVGILVPPLVAFMLFSIMLFSIQLVFVDRTNREAKRFSNQALSPVLTNISETLNAKNIIQTMNFGDFFVRRHCDAVDEYNRFAILSQTVVNLGTMATGFLAFFVSTGAAFLVVGLREKLDPSIIGLALVYSQIQPYFLSILSMVLPIGLTALTSLERILEYCSPAVIPSELPWHVLGDDELLKEKHWPQTGAIEFENVVLVYRAGMSPSLRNVSFSIQGGEVLGIVGKTGAGKSSLIQALLRIHEVTSGRVLIDGVDVGLIGIQTLRTQIAIIPQDPVLLRGNVRFNLDPFGIYTEDNLLEASSRVGLSRVSLEKKSAEFLSAGERQLLQLARVILRGDSVRIVLLDESTANIDTITDRALNMVIREAFVGKTRLVIAHRLSTVADWKNQNEKNLSDKILVMGAGAVVEFGAPNDLLRDKYSAFYAMMKAYSGHDEEEQVVPRDAADFEDEEDDEDNSKNV